MLDVDNMCILVTYAQQTLLNLNVLKNIHRHFLNKSMLLFVSVFLQDRWKSVEVFTVIRGKCPTGIHLPLFKQSCYGHEVHAPFRR